MLRVLDERRQIEAAQKRWKERTLEANPIRQSTPLGWKGGDSQGTLTLYWLPNRLWVAHEPEHNRWWNPCGLESPLEQRSPDIVVEINPPFEGVNTKVTGAFAVDEGGKLCLIHRGWLGGGNHSVTKQVFFRHFQGRTGYIGPKETHRVAIVGELDSPTFLDDLAFFIRECRRLKLGIESA
jgi:hypothetical protein